MRRASIIPDAGKAPSLPCEGLTGKSAGHLEKRLLHREAPVQRTSSRYPGTAAGGGSRRVALAKGALAFLSAVRRAVFSLSSRSGQCFQA